MLKVQKMLVSAMARLDETMVINLVTQGLEMGINPHILIEEVRMGTARVGEMYNKGTYFLSDLIVASEIFQDVIALVMDGKTAKLSYQYAPIVFGTVKEDIHDIGKKITIGMLNYSGFEVYDLGVDVPAHLFVEAANKTNSKIVCLAGLITSSYDSMKRTIQVFEENGLRSQTKIIIGGLVNDSVLRYTGADYWSADCAHALELCRNILANVDSYDNDKLKTCIHR